MAFSTAGSSESVPLASQSLDDSELVSSRGGICFCRFQKEHISLATLREALGRIGAIVFPDPQALVPHTARLFDEQVDLRDEDTREEVRHLVDALAHWCRRVQPEEPVSAPSATGS
jgi:hypothetical protein